MAGVDTIQKSTTVGDAAVDGLLAGLGAGLLMVLYWIIVGFFTSDGWATWLAYFDLSGAMLPLTGGLTVLSIAAVYGVLFGVLVWLTPRAWRRPLRDWPLALGYTLLLLFLAQTLFLPRLDSPVRAIPWLPMLFGHLVYGLTLGRLIKNAAVFTRQ